MFPVEFAHFLGQRGGRQIARVLDVEHVLELTRVEVTIAFEAKADLGVGVDRDLKQRALLARQSMRDLGAMKAASLQLRFERAICVAERVFVGAIALAQRVARQRFGHALGSLGPAKRRSGARRWCAVAPGSRRS